MGVRRRTSKESAAQSDETFWLARYILGLVAGSAAVPSSSEPVKQRMPWESEAGPAKSQRPNLMRHFGWQGIS